MSGTNDSRQKFTAIASIAFIALLGVIAFLLWNKTEQDSKIDIQANEIMEAERLQVDLEKQYYEALSELESMKTGNEELNALIETQKTELEGQRNKIKKMIRSGNTSEANLNEARNQIAAIKSQLDGYVVQVDQLIVEKNMLEEQNLQLTTQNQDLNSNLITEKSANEQLASARASLLSEKEILQTEQKQLKGLVTKASVVKVGDVSASAWKVKKSGKPTKTKSASKTDRIKVCFTTDPNDVAQPGNEEFYIRVISPQGETMAIESMGSGIMKTHNNEDIRYTQIKKLPYENNSLVGCFLWEPNLTFSKGLYNIEVYNKGHLSGQGNFLLK